jgi:hypothetical protein
VFARLTRCSGSAPGTCTMAVFSDSFPFRAAEPPSRLSRPVIPVSIISADVKTCYFRLPFGSEFLGSSFATQVCRHCERAESGRDYKATRWRSALGSAVTRRQPRHFVR